MIIEKVFGREGTIREETRKLFLHIYRVLSELKVPDNPIRQKKEGQCRLPPGVCLAKDAFAVYERIDEQTESEVRRG